MAQSGYQPRRQVKENEESEENKADRNEKSPSCTKQEGDQC
ncbi:hypothetical protein THOG11_130030 [Vibrio harveyi]|nr:hypothetical protein THOG11_130030 [Vibrio harveyi]